MNRQWWNTLVGNLIGDSTLKCTCWTSLNKLAPVSCVWTNPRGDVDRHKNPGKSQQHVRGLWKKMERLTFLLTWSHLCVCLRPFPAVCKQGPLIYLWLNLCVSCCPLQDDYCYNCRKRKRTFLSLDYKTMIQKLLKQTITQHSNCLLGVVNDNKYKYIIMLYMMRGKFSFSFKKWLKGNSNWVIW